MWLFNNKELIEKLSRISDIKEMLDKSLEESIAKLDELNHIEIRLRNEFEKKEERLKKEITVAEELLEKRVQKSNNEIDRIIKEKTQGFPWLADAIAQYHYEYIDLKVEEYLRNKLRPAISSADRVREIANEKRELKKKFLITRNLIKYYESLFPWIVEYVGEDIDELLIQVSNKKEIDEEADPVRIFVPEYESLSVTERNQKALDRYWAKKKSSWEIGRDYERYIGYLYEKEGYLVQYQGIEKGLEDLGRDLICIKDNRVIIVQCKYWRQEKIINEKHVNQLFGTMVQYFIENCSYNKNIQMDLFPTLLSNNNISGIIITSASLSNTAKAFAKVLGVEVKEKFPLDKHYPSIKCNVSRKDGSKIYHLPFDQQYDRTIIEDERNERYVNTVKEAERLGFRRAWRWRGNDRDG